MRQLSPRYLHVRAGLTGVLDFLFETYLAEGEAAGLSFTEWVESEAYDPAVLKARFRAGWWGSAADRAAPAAGVAGIRNVALSRAA